MSIRLLRAGTPLRRRALPGFSLVELLVVIAIVMLLAGLMAPALRRSQDQMRGVACLGHLRQWGWATQLYAGDHEDLIPPEGVPNPAEQHTNVGWYIQLPRQIGVPAYHTQPWRTNALAPIGNSIWLCPANRRRSNGRNLFHYCLNQHVDGTSTDEMPVRLSALSDPAATVWLFDSKNLPAVGTWNFVHTNLHSAGAQFQFLDGHAARFRVAEYWDFTLDKGRTNNPEIIWIP